MKEHVDTEQAFLKIRACAGNDDVKEIVAKFMTREQTYVSLLSSVQALESKYDKLKTENGQKKEYLHALEIENDNKKPVGFIDPRHADRQLAHEIAEMPNDNVAESDYKRLSEELDHLRAHVDQLHSRKKNVQLINDQVGGWTSRVSKKLADLLDDHTLDNNKSTTILQQFKNISTLVHQ